MISSVMTVCVATLFLGQPGTLGPTRVAVVSIAQVNERYARTADLEAKFEVKRLQFKDERDALRKRIERTTRSLQEELKPGSEAFEARRKELVMLEAEMQWFLDSTGREIDTGLATSLRSIYSDIRSMVGEVAAERGVDIVLTADELSPDAPDNPVRSRQEILLQKVIYWSPKIDLTDEVARRLNARYRAQQAGESP